MVQESGHWLALEGRNAQPSSRFFAPHVLDREISSRFMTLTWHFQCCSYVNYMDTCCVEMRDLLQTAVQILLGQAHVIMVYVQELLAGEPSIRRWPQSASSRREWFHFRHFIDIIVVILLFFFFFFLKISIKNLN